MTTTYTTDTHASELTPVTNTRAIFPIHDALSSYGARLHIQFDPWAAPISSKRDLYRESTAFSYVLLDAYHTSLLIDDVQIFSTMIVSAFPELPDGGDNIVSNLLDIMEVLEITTAKGLVIQLVQESFTLQALSEGVSICSLGAYFLSCIQYNLELSDKRASEALSIASNVIDLLKVQLASSFLNSSSEIRKAVMELAEGCAGHMQHSKLSVLEAVSKQFSVSPERVENPYPVAVAG